MAALQISLRRFFAHQLSFDSVANQVFRPRFRKQLLSILAEMNFTVDSEFMKEVRDAFFNH
jgi:hypothetical protein